MKRRSIRDILLVVLVAVIGLCFLTGVIWILMERIKEFTTITSDPSNDIVRTLTLVGSILVAVFKKCYEAKKENAKVVNCLNYYMAHNKKSKRPIRPKPIKTTIHTSLLKTSLLLNKTKGRFHHQ